MQKLFIVNLIAVLMITPLLCASENCESNRELSDSLEAGIKGAIFKQNKVFFVARPKASKKQRVSRKNMKRHQRSGFQQPLLQQPIKVENFGDPEEAIKKEEEEIRVRQQMLASQNRGQCSLNCRGGGPIGNQDVNKTAAANFLCHILKEDFNNASESKVKSFMLIMVNSLDQHNYDWLISKINSVNSACNNESMEQIKKHMQRFVNGKALRLAEDSDEVGREKTRLLNWANELGMFASSISEGSDEALDRGVALTEQKNELEGWYTDRKKKLQDLHKNLESHSEELVTVRETLWKQNSDAKKWDRCYSCTLFTGGVTVGGLVTWLILSLV